MSNKPRVAIVCDWLTNMGGAENVVLSLAKAFPGAPIFTSVYTPETMPKFAKLDVRTTYLQKLPKALRARHQLFPLLRTHAFRKLDLSEYDVVISSSSAEAKAVITRPDAVHICYCHTPTRYYWSHYKEYLAEPGLGPLNPIARLLLPLFVGVLRRSDLRAVKGVDYFIANSSTVAERIKKYYHRDSRIINPPVDMTRFRPLDITGKRRGFVIVGRQVPYKRMDLAVKACTQLNLPLTVLGHGPTHEQLKKLAGTNVTFKTDASDTQVAQALTQATGFIFPQNEDFGITQVEALAAGCPVIAYAKGGALDVITDGKTGVFFKEQTVKSLSEALQRVQTMRFAPKLLHNHAEQFSEERFIAQMKEFVCDHNPKFK